MRSDRADRAQLQYRNKANNGFISLLTTTTCQVRWTTELTTTTRVIAMLYFLASLFAISFANVSLGSLAYAACSTCFIQRVLIFYLCKYSTLIQHRWWRGDSEQQSGEVRLGIGRRGGLEEHPQVRALTRSIFTTLSMTCVLTLEYGVILRDLFFTT